MALTKRERAAKNRKRIVKASIKAQQRKGNYKKKT